VGGRGGDETDARELIAEAGHTGLRLDAFLVARGAFPSRAAAQRAIELGHVSVDGTDRPKNFRIEQGARIRIDHSSDATPRPAAAAGVDFAVVYEDPHLMVVDKPAGVVTHTAPGHDGVTLAEVLPPGSRIVHRLDKDTSGLLVVARSEEAHAALQGMMKARDVTREYLALIEGHPDAETGTIDAPIGRDRANRTVMSTRSDRPREAVTHFEVVERLPRDLQGTRIVSATRQWRGDQIRQAYDGPDFPCARSC
jgi:23S rRNA pseudouridine1911/1915/1917 synthase